MSPADMAALLESLSERLHPRVPTGNGFCLYVRRHVLDAVGAFDEQAFAGGCGEENDFCMRASRRGFVHLIDDATYVHHHRSASLGRRKHWLVLRSSWVLRHRHPDYRQRVAAWLAADPLDPLRGLLQERLASWPGEMAAPQSAGPVRD
jgi:GT2 family glycosyltransferase